MGILEEAESQANERIKVPEIIYLANKSENGFEGDILSDFYRMLPGVS
jgi:GTP-binding protein